MDILSIPLMVNPNLYGKNIFESLSVICAPGVIFDHVYPQVPKKRQNLKACKGAELQYSIWLAATADEKNIWLWNITLKFV